MVNRAAWPVLLAALLVGCNMFGRSGEGALTTETRQVAPFTHVEAGGGIAVVISIGPTTAVTVTAQANILPIIATDVAGDTLTIHSTQSYNTTVGVTVNIVVPDLEGITLGGGSQGTATGISGEQLDINLSGGAGLTASGTVTALALNVSGGARATLDALLTQAVTADLSGGANATVSASISVYGSASGGAHLTVLGGGAINVQTSGGASVSSN